MTMFVTVSGTEHRKGDSDRVAQEKLIKRGSWLASFDTFSYWSGGIKYTYVQIDPKVKPKKDRIWLVEWSHWRYTGNDDLDTFFVKEWRRHALNA